MTLDWHVVDDHIRISRECAIRPKLPRPCFRAIFFWKKSQMGGRDRSRPVPTTLDGDRSGSGCAIWSGKHPPRQRLARNECDFGSGASKVSYASIREDGSCWASSAAVHRPI